MESLLSGTETAETLRGRLATATTGAANGVFVDALGCAVNPETLEGLINELRVLLGDRLALRPSALAATRKE